MSAFACPQESRQVFNPGLLPRRTGQGLPPRSRRQRSRCSGLEPVLLVVCFYAKQAGSRSPSGLRSEPYSRTAYAPVQSCTFDSMPPTHLSNIFWTQASAPGYGAPIPHPCQHQMLCNNRHGEVEEMSHSPPDRGLPASRISVLSTGRGMGCNGVHTPPSISTYVCTGYILVASGQHI